MDEISQIKQRIDIVALLSEYIPLKKAGSNYKARCPFHGEKTPSFVVSGERGVWHCFGCQKGGDIFTFLNEYEHIEFAESLRILAKKAGVELSGKGFQANTYSKKESLYAVNAIASEFYHYVLTKHPVGEKALKYLVEKRRLTPKIIETFAIGYAPGVGDALTSYLTVKKKYEKELLQEAGLVSIKGQRISDFFMNRIVFPLIDHRGNVLGFSARALNDFSMPKYLNTRDTLVYQKGEHLFGISVTKDEIKKQNQAIIVEGEFDVISSYQNGIGNVVAVKGTALTAAHATLLSRFTNKVSLCFDMDSAGQDALKRSLSVLEQKGFLITVVTLSEGKDPDESLHHDPYELKNAIKKDVHVYDYLLQKYLGEFDSATVVGKKKISELLLPIFAQISSEIVKEHYIRLLCEQLHTSYESMSLELQKYGKQGIPIEKENSVLPPLLRDEVLGEYLLALLLQLEKPEEVIREYLSSLHTVIGNEKAYQKLLQLLYAHCVQHPLHVKEFVLQIPTELVSYYDRAWLFPLPKFDEKKKYLQEIKKTVSELQTVLIRQKITEKTLQIKQLEKEQKAEEIEKLQQDISNLLPLLPK